MSRHNQELLVLYDGNCNLCLNVVRQIRQLRVRADLRFMAVQSLRNEAVDLSRIAEPARTWLLGSGHEQLLDQLHIVDPYGNIEKGAAAVIRILQNVKGFAWLNGLYRVPGLGRAAEALYRFIAKRRYAWFGTVDAGCNGSCRTKTRMNENN
ncbi:putative DCC family thiol-disulfide oxidoreductase YuxK [Paenibacillus phyllosphaerae]|uniref:Putative DCC family thiol-disulfide oxidoreductase YuxK n=1 Tax=Paenibacillus phyllosphaerae TaxID=274593 RepID=A0A7W5AWK9_9BACL|nr:DUF393 domain-containing protein [Paenibacillus phyllosphaerae]MBB3109922.1 putative DCC family thiol-disulfide oxidoreductase YuxK [Paenibacillus phyllosphaerae]